MKRGSKVIWVCLAASVLAGYVLVYVLAYYMGDPVRKTPTDLRLSASRTRRVEMYGPEGPGNAEKGRVVELPSGDFKKLIQGIRRHGEILDDGCKCGTYGVQLATHLDGEPNYVQLTRVPCGYFILHDGKKKTYVRFYSSALQALLDQVLPKSEVDAGPGSPAPDAG